MPPLDSAPPALLLGHLLTAFGVSNPDDVLAIRHTSLAHGLPDVNSATPEAVLAYTRDQDARHRVFPETPAPIWLVFMEDGSHDGSHRSRFFGAFDNAGESLDERTETNRRFNLAPSTLMASLANRLVIEWTTPRRWHRRGALAAEFRVLEVADPQVVPFPGFDRVRLTYSELHRILDDPLYSRWHSALRAVKGVYLIADASNGKHYVGKADGVDGVLGRWQAYAGDGHGGNVALRDLHNLDLSHREHFVFSILRVFGPEATQTQILNAESHYKSALLSRSFGYNEN